jgi:hypothetical protein
MIPSKKEKPRGLRGYLWEGLTASPANLYHIHFRFQGQKGGNR